jgi:hypothetical protein
VDSDAGIFVNAESCAAVKYAPTIAGTPRVRFGATARCIGPIIVALVGDVRHVPLASTTTPSPNTTDAFASAKLGGKRSAVPKRTSSVTRRVGESGSALDVNEKNDRTRPASAACGSNSR